MKSTSYASLPSILSLARHLVLQNHRSCGRPPFGIYFDDANFESNCSSQGISDFAKFLGSLRPRLSDFYSPNLWLYGEKVNAGTEDGSMFRKVTIRQHEKVGR